MTLLFYSIIVFFSLGQLQRLAVADGNIAVYVYEFLMAGFVVVWLLHRRKKLDHRLFKPLAIFIFTLFLSLVVGGTAYPSLVNLVAVLYFLKIVLYCLFFGALQSVPREHIKKGLVALIGLTIIFSTFQYLLYPNLRHLSYLGWDPHYGRAFGLFFDTTVAGVIYSLYALYLLNDIKNIRDFVGIRGVGVIILFGLVVLTYSRITYVSLFVAIGYFLWKKGAAKYFVLAATLLIVAIIFLPKGGGESVNLGRTFTIVARVDDWKEAMATGAKKPILGVGYNRIGHYRNLPAGNHAKNAFSSSYLTIFVASGFVGLMAFLYMLSRFFTLGDTMTRSGQLLIITASFFDNIFLHGFVLLLFFILFSLNQAHMSAQSP